MTRRYTLAFAPGTRFLSANDHLHHMAAHRIRRQLSETAGWLAVHVHKIPAMKQAEFRLEYQLPTPETRKDPRSSRSLRDHENLAPTAKAFVDGIVRAGVLPGDSRKYVPAAPLCQLSGVRHPFGRLLLHITEIGEQNDEPAG